jgi:hypothetical protein
VSVGVEVIKVVVIVGETDGLPVGLGEAEGDGVSVGVSCRGGAARVPPARIKSQTKARPGPSVKAMPSLRRPKKRIARRMMVCIVRVIILMLFYVKNIISCSFIHPIYTQGIHRYLWTSLPFP